MLKAVPLTLIISNTKTKLYADWFLSYGNVNSVGPAWLSSLSYSEE